MSIIKCNECSKEVSTKAKTCPNCGAPVKQTISLLRLFKGIVFAFVGLIIIAAIFFDEENSNTNTITKTAPTKQILAPKINKTTSTKTAADQWDWSGSEKELEHIKNTVKEIKPDPLKNGLSQIQTKKLNAFKKILDNLTETGVITSIDDEETIARLYINTANWNNTLHTEKVNFAFGMFQYFNLLHLSAKKPPIDSLYLRDAYTNESLGMYSATIGASIN